MTQDPFTIALLGGMGGIIIAMIGSWAKGVLERMAGVERNVERHTERAHDIDREQVEAIATLKAEVATLKADFREERARCGELTERMARQESFQAWAEPLLEKAVAGLTQAVQFEARFEERLVTLFKGLGAITQRVERMLPAHAAAN